MAQDSGGPDSGADELRTLLAGSNINEKSFLATDYLNHFNEIVMYIDLIPEMESCLTEAREWRPKSYTEHFEDSAFSARALAIRAYALAPPPIRIRFDDAVDWLNRLVALCLDRIESTAATGDGEALRETATQASHDLRRMIDVISAIINGADPRIGQEEIDAMFEERG